MTSTFHGNCHNCGQYGHRNFECPVKIQGLANFTQEQANDPYAGTFTEPIYAEQQQYEMANIHTDFDQGTFEEEYLEDVFESDNQRMDDNAL
jgi:hypothetical protein